MAGIVIILFIYFIYVIVYIQALSIWYLAPSECTWYKQLISFIC